MAWTRPYRDLWRVLLILLLSLPACRSTPPPQELEFLEYFSHFPPVKLTYALEFSQIEFHNMAVSGWKLPAEQKGPSFFWTEGPEAQLQMLFSEAVEYSMSFQCRVNAVFDLKVVLNGTSLPELRLKKGKNVQRVQLPKTGVRAGLNRITFKFQQLSEKLTKRPRIVLRRLEFSPKPQRHPSQLVLYPEEKRVVFQGTLSSHFFLKTGKASQLRFRHRLSGTSGDQPDFLLSVENHLGEKVSRTIVSEAEVWKEARIDLSPFENQVVKVRFLHVSSGQTGTEIDQPKIEFHPPEIEKRRILLVGLDGADWSVIRPLLKQGRLPHLQRLIENGVSAPLRTVQPWYSPVIWTTIVTGKGMAQHGIQGFVQQQKEKDRIIPNSRLSRTCLALWNILSSRGLTVGLVGPWVTWPAELVNGFVLSDRMYFENLPATTYPHELKSLIFHRYRPQAGSSKDPEYHSLKRLLLPEGLKLRPSTAENIRNELLYIQQDQLKRIAGSELISILKPDFSFVYLRGPDVSSHFFWQYYEPDETVPKEEVRAFQEVIPKNYEYQDYVLGDLLRSCGEDVTTLVVSDHGMGKKSYARSTREISGDHTMFGILIMAGEGIQADVWLEACSVLDITPTILHLLGLPVGKDMEGEVITAALTSRFRTQHPIQYIPTYENPGSRSAEQAETAQPDRDLDKELIERLRSLGYIK